MTRGVTTWVRERLATPPAIYGLIVYNVVVAIASDHQPSALGVLGSSALSLVVFFIAHVFAEAVAHHGEHGVRSALRYGFGYSLGMLWASVVPTLALLTCAALGVPGDPSDDVAGVVSLVVLAFLGWQATADRGWGVAARALGGAVTAALGFVIMALDYAVH